MTPMTRRSSYGALLLAFSGACAGTSNQLAAVARHDLACDQTEVAKIAENRYAASGCGRSGTYAELCSGGSCSWVRVRSPEELAATSGGSLPPGSVPIQRDVIAAPPPAQREVIAAPPPAQREIIPAPPPASEANAAPGSDAQPTAPAPSSTDGGAQQQGFTPQPTPLSDGSLTDPYETEVPAQPTAQRVQYPPPTPLYEQQAPPPAPSYVWIGGYWWWGALGWTWVPGYWCPPRMGYRYVAGSWYWSSGYWWYGPGGWALPGSTLIVYHAPPRPSRVAVVRSFTPYRVVSGAPRHVGSAGPGVGAASAPLGRPAAAPAPGRFGATPAPGRFGAAPAPGRFGAAPAPGRVGVAAPASRSYTPQGSPLYRYPAATTRPAPTRFGATTHGVQSPSAGFGGSTHPPPAPQRFGGSPAPSHSYRGSTFSRMPAPAPAPAPHHTVRPSFGSPSPSPAPRPSFGSPSPSPAPMRAPSMSRMPSSGGNSAPAHVPARAPQRGGSVGRR